MEIQHHGLDIDARLVDGATRVARRLDLPLIATNDVHYVRADHARTHELLLCIQTQTTMDDPKRMRLETPEFYLKTPDEMHGLFSNYPESLSNSVAIAERCNLELTFGRTQLPRFETPNGKSSEAYLRELCAKGLTGRYGEVTGPIQTRLDYELDVICTTGFVDYFLLVHDVIRFAREAGIAVGPGRGSSAGSIVAYVLHLTDIDPIVHGLSFERFLNPQRVTMPDMDLDFADDRRDEVIRYVTEKYGRDHVAQIITFGTLAPKAGMRDVGRVQGMPLQDVERVARLVPQLCSRLAQAKADVPELKQLYEGDPSMRDFMDTVETLEGVARHASTHPAGVVISLDPLAEHVPLYKVPKNDQVTTQYAMSSIEQMGLLKLDLLGLRTLTILQRAQRFVEQTTGQPFDLDNIPLDHPSIYELLRTGETFGVFQVDSDGFRRLLRGLQPEVFEHIVALNALYRPGPMQEIPKYVERRHGREQVHYIHPALKEVLEPTHGIFVYQEQVMRLFIEVAGYSPGEADLIRRAMSKKKAAELAKHYEIFLERAEAHGTNRDVAQQLWNIVEPFASYAFNKSHSAAYAVTTCRTAYLKANYPREYMAGLLSAETDRSDRIADAMADCRRLGIEILPPDINASAIDFTLDGEGIRFGLRAIKNVGSAIESVLRARTEGGPFASLDDFCVRVDWQAVNKRVIDSLARCGAFDSLGVDRGRAVAGVDRIVAFGSQMQRAAAAGQVSLFGDVAASPAMLELGVAEAASLQERAAWEQELLGTVVSPHPLTCAESDIRSSGAVMVSEVIANGNGQVVTVAGMVRGLRTRSTKLGQPMAVLQLADLNKSLEVVVFSRTYERVGPTLAENAIVVVDGKFDVAEGPLRLLADAIYSLEEAKKRRSGADVRPDAVSARSGTNGKKSNGSGSFGRAAQISRHRLVIEFPRGDDRVEDLERLERVYAVLQRHHGADEVEMRVRYGNNFRSLALPNKTVAVCEQLEEELGKLLPVGGWRVTLRESASGEGA